MVVIKVCFQQNPILQTSNGPIAGDPFQTGTFEMHGSTQGEVFFKTRVKAEARIVMWMENSSLYSCLCVLEVFLPWSSPRGTDPAAATPMSPGQGHSTVSPFWLQLKGCKSSSDGTSPCLQEERVCRQGLNGYRDGNCRKINL